MIITEPGLSATPAGIEAGHSKADADESHAD
jgi:hypothetical protein